ncbi:MAG TPA: hypothetical protein VK737_09860 [Opitutales bacterium]|jgi:hypothetical protein|nr:hypothetical protein [Opitutales bacterium]
MPLALAGALPTIYRHGTAVEWPTTAGGNGHFFEAVETPGGITWEAAETYARLHGGYLAIVRSAAENQFLFHLIDDPKYWVGDAPYDDRNLGPWLGGHRLPGAATPDKDWVWTHTNTPITYTNWAPTEPDDGYGDDTENHLQFFSLDPSLRQATWNDIGDRYPLHGLVVEYESRPQGGYAGAASLMLPANELPNLQVPLLIASSFAALLFLAGIWIYLFRRPREEKTSSDELNARGEKSDGKGEW